MDRANKQLQYAAIYSGAGTCLLEDRLIVRISGDDRTSFMHGMCTADVKSLTAGKLSRALFVTEHAHVIAEVVLYALDEVLWLEVERSRWSVIQQHLEQFLVADDVEFEELENLEVLDVEGPAAIEPLTSILGTPLRKLSDWQHLANDSLRVANFPRYGLPAFTVIGQHSALLDLMEQMKKACPELHELGREVLETIRIENGLAHVGTDTNERTLALEARLEPAISFNKGCYVGQETIERATARGALKKRLCGIRIFGNELPSTGAVVRFEGREVGHLTSVAESPANGIVGLAILHHTAWPVGSSVAIDSNKETVSGVICELPFGNR